MSKVYALVATIPERRSSCERLLGELYSHQSRVVDGVLLVLDGYGEETNDGEWLSPQPSCPLPIGGILYNRPPNPRPVGPFSFTGAGQRWRAAESIEPDDILVCIDDDCMTIEAPRMVEALVEAVEKGGGASAAMGRTFDNRPAPPGLFSFGTLVHGAGCGLTARARDLVGVMEYGQALFASGGPDCLGVGGDDDALVSAWLWSRQVAITHATTGNIYAAPNTRPTTGVRGRANDEQKHALKRAMGWPWPAEKGKW